jgi:hypothetical protein
MALPTETFIPSDEIFESMTAVRDSGFAGIPFVPGEWGILNWVYLLLIIGWIGLVMLTGYCIKVNPAAHIRDMDTDTLMVLNAWIGLILLTAYTLRILHGP